MPVDEADVRRNSGVETPEKTEQTRDGPSGCFDMVRESQPLPDGRSITFYWFDKPTADGDGSSTHLNV